MFKSSSTSSFEVSFEEHSDIENDSIYRNPYNTGGLGLGNQSGTEISVETFVGPLLPEIIIDLLPHNDDQTFVKLYDEDTLIGGGKF